MRVRVVLVSYCRSETAYREALSVAHEVVLVLRSGDPRAHEDEIRALGADLILVAGCPVKLPASFREAARVGAVNCHPSVLPRYRGRDPVFWTILNGERSTGITLHRMTDEIDAGPVLLQRAIDVPERSTSVTLSRDLDVLGADLAVELCSMAERGDLPEGSPQQGEPSSYPSLRAELGRIDWTRDAAHTGRLVRACAGEIHAFTIWSGMKLVVLEAEPVAEVSAAAPGTIVSIDASGMRVAASAGHVLVRRFLFVERVLSAPELADHVGLYEGARLDT